MWEKTTASHYRLLPYRILRLVESGQYPAKIARLLGVKRELVNYYLRRFLKMGLVKKTRLGKISVYELTEHGRVFLTGGERGVGVGGRVFRLHGFGVGFPVLGGPGVGVDWGRVREVRMRNWSKVLGCWRNVTWCLTTKQLIIYPEPVEGRDPYELLYLVMREVDEVASELEQRLKLQLGRPHFVGRPSWAVWDENAQRFTEFMNVTDDVGSMDKSPPSPGEIEYWNPELAKEYMLMPIRLKQLTLEQKERQDRIEKILVQFAEQLKLHLEVLQGIREAFARFNQLLETATDQKTVRGRGREPDYIL
ncbi:MAG: helix-turn-helix domain-containing protein [Candidatus Caldarchaeum sp.]